MSITKWHYLVREKDRILVTKKAPKGLTFSPQETLWFFNAFEFPIGCPDPTRFLYSESWEGPIGVFNIDDSEQVLNAFQLVQNHVIEICRVAVRSKLRSNGVELEKPSKDPHYVFHNTAVSSAVNDACNELLAAVFQSRQKR